MILIQSIISPILIRVYLRMNVFKFLEVLQSQITRKEEMMEKIKVDLEEMRQKLSELKSSSD